MLSRAAWLVSLAFLDVQASEELACDRAGESPCPVRVSPTDVDEEEGDDVGLLHLRAGVSNVQQSDGEDNFGPIYPTTLTTTPGCPIQTAQQYSDAWHELAKPETKPGGYKARPGCVSQELYGSVKGCTDDTLYGDAAEKAWIVSKVDLEQFLTVQWRYGSNPAKVTAGLLVIIGFGPPLLNQTQSGLCLGLFNLPKPYYAAKYDIIPRVPVGAYWFTYMSERGYFFEAPVQKKLIIEYSHVSQENVLDVFSRLTQCSVTSLETGLDPSLENGCSSSSVAVWNALGDYAQNGIQPCVKLFWENANNDWSRHNVGDVRMMLWRCFDVNPFNTLVGLGWNSYPNPLVCKAPGDQTNDDHYTGKEYVIPNVKDKHFVGFKQIPLATAERDSNLELIANGFCKGED